MSNYKISPEVRKIAENNAIAKKLVNKWIKKLTDEGYSYDEMIEVFRLAKKKADILLNKKK